MKKTVLLCMLMAVQLGFMANTVAQRRQAPPAPADPPATEAKVRLEGFKLRQELKKNSLVKAIPFNSVGPTVMSGRVVDVDVNAEDPTRFLVAYASGGLWISENNGTTFSPLFDQESSMTIGDIAAVWKNGKPEVIWIGTGENNSSRSSYAGTGMFKSTDGGKTWQHMGLDDSHHIGRIVINPKNPDHVVVASLGRLYSANNERGIFRTTNGGKTWNRTLFVNNNTGAVDLVADPSNPDVLYTAMWERTRRAWDFNGSGTGSGIYKSTDGGATWTRLSTPESGFPTTAGVGRIGLDVFPGNPQIIYAVLDNQDRREADNTTTNAPRIRPDQFKSMTTEQLMALSNEDLTAYLDRFNFPPKYTASQIKADVSKGKYQPRALADFLNANDDLFNTPIKGAEMYRSDDGGKTWKKTHEGYIDDLFYTYGYYFGQVRVDANNPDIVYTMGVPVIKSENGGKTWTSISGDNTHADHHALWINPQNPKHLLLGNDGGLNLSYDAGKSWTKINPIPLGQFYAVTYDMATPYNIYGGLQDNGVWYGPHNYRAGTGWQMDGDYPYKSLLGGDGMQVQVDFRDNTTVYTGFQFGNYYRIDRTTGRSKSITPRHELGEAPYRWNWQTPIHLSRHNQDILYMGSHRFHRSMDKGDSFVTLSGDLTAGGKEGNVPYGTLTTIDESPMRFGLLYTGSDDGYIHVSKDAGQTWTRISDKLPSKFWVSRVCASHHKEGRVYASLNGYRWDNFEAMIFVSDDYGNNWRRIGRNLPAEPVNVVKEDPANENIVYVGTDHGIYISFDKGDTFMAFSSGLPDVAVHDLAIHPREKHLIAGTHGRSVYLADLSQIQQLTPEILVKALHTFTPRPVTHFDWWGRARGNWRDAFEPSVNLSCYVNYTMSGATTKVRILSAAGLMLKEFTFAGEAGINSQNYNLSVDAKAVEAYNKELQAKNKDAKAEAAANGTVYLQPGDYTVEFVAGEATEKQTLKIEAARSRMPRGR